MEHLEWGLRQAGGRGSLIVTDGVFSMDGDVAPLEHIVELARRYDARVMVDEAHATGVLGPGGRGSVAAAGLEGEVDVVVGTLGKALGSYGAYVCCDKAMERYLVNTARTLIFSTGPAPPVVAAAWPRSRSLVEQPRRVERLRRNALTLRYCARRPGLRRPRRRDADRAARGRRRRDRDGALRARCCAPACSPRRSARRPCPTARRGCASPRWRPTTPPSCERAAAQLGRRVRQGRRTAPREPEHRGAGLRLCRVAAADAPRGLFVTGTDTEVGKTVVASAIAATLAARGERVSVFKPAVTGLDELDGMGADHERLRAAARSSQLAAGRRALPVRAPRVPAPGRGCAGRPVDPDRLLAAARRAAAAGDVLVAEGVGGLLVPLSGTTWCATSPPTSGCRS